MSLFRKQALEAQYDKTWGEVNISQPMKYTVLTIVVSTFVILTITFISLAEFNKREQVSGYLTPSKGLFNLYSPGHLLLSKILVEEGDTVKKGQTLFVLTSPKNLISGQDAQQLLLHEIQNQIELLKAQIKSLDETFILQNIELTSDLNNLVIQQNLNERQLNKTQKKLVLSALQLKNFNSMLQQKLIAKQQIETATEKHLLVEQEEIQALNQIALNAQQQNKVKQQITKLPITTQQQRQTLSLQLSDKIQQLANTKSQNEILIKAELDGSVSSLLAKQGQWLKAQEFIASLLPDNTELHAELLVPTRAFGFIKKEQDARIKLAAFPFQKFGSINGKIFQASSSVLPQHTSALNSEAVYRVKVELEQQSITAYGQSMSLKAGMLLTADVLLDKRSLAEWLLDPLLSLNK